MFVLYNYYEVVLMNNELVLVKIKEDYCNYLRLFDHKVPYNYERKDTRPFIGVLFEVNNCKYFAPLSSPKPKYLKMKNKLDFLKLDNGKLGAINFNNMLPVEDNNIIKLDLSRKDLNAKEIKYQKLLIEQIYWLNRNSKKLYSKSKRLYDNYITRKLDKNTYVRCCDFKLLEIKCKEYNSKR